MYYSWKTHVFIHASMKQCLQSVNHEQFPIQMTQNNKYNKWLEILDFQTKLSGERRLKFIASGEDDDNKKPRAKHRTWHRLAQRRQRRQASDHKHVQRQRQNTRIPLQMEPMKRGNTDCRPFKTRWGDQATLTVYSKIIFFDATKQQLHDLYNARQEYLSNGLRKAYQRLHHDHHWVLQ